MPHGRSSCFQDMGILDRYGLPRRIKPPFATPHNTGVSASHVHVSGSERLTYKTGAPRNEYGEPCPPQLQAPRCPLLLQLLQFSELTQAFRSQLFRFASGTPAPGDSWSRKKDHARRKPKGTKRNQRRCEIGPRGA